jgi:hypothetical protein
MSKEPSGSIVPNQQRALDRIEAGPSLDSDAKASRTGAFTDNMKLPVHRWLRYSAGFSAEWVERVVRDHCPPEGLFFDPFAGSGTALLAAQAAGIQSAGAESHPFVVRIAEAKLAWQSDPALLEARAGALVGRANAIVAGHDVTSELLLKCYSGPALAQLETLRRAFLEEPKSDPISSLLWLAITAILRECSGVGTAQWQYILPNKSKARVVQPFDAFAMRIAMFCSDMRNHRITVDRPMCEATVAADDARTLAGFSGLAGKVDLIVTSPPYPNNYDYADATRLEMTFWREIARWSDLQNAVRHKLVRSCSQHSAAEKLDLESLLDDEAISPIRDELSTVCNALSEARETRAGKKTYHTMVGAYFNDLALTWRALRKLCTDDAKVCFVIGDSAPYGVHVPAERWLATLAVAEGFSSPQFEKIRDRNMKWKNRKHRVPLLEGNLWVRG